MFRILRYLLLVLFICVIGVVASPASAAESTENFATDYHLIYAVAEDGMAHATLRVTLTNLTSDYYASSYKFQLGFEHLLNMQVTDVGGKIVPVMTKTDVGQYIALTFNKNIVGFNNKQVITVTFDTPDIAKRQGMIWEINIPGIANQSDFASFDVTLQVPKNFGDPAYIKPSDVCHSRVDSRMRPDQIGDRGNDRSCVMPLTFTKEQLGTSGISIAFGDKQAYIYSLFYHLQNKNLFPIRTEIALPASTNYQEVGIESLFPEPIQVRQDQDGNWLAEYELLPSQRVNVVARGKVVLSLTPKRELVSANILKQYLQEKPYWQTSNTKIQELAKQLKTPEAIYTYVVKTLNYDFSRVTGGKSRLGAVDVLQHPSSAVCLEFTDLFIAIARAAGIPAREVDGYAYTQNPRQRPLSLVQDILHAWPEYYDSSQQTWLMVDPTWGNTTGGVDYFYTLDFDHMTLVKKGISSTYPIPAGGYKTTDDEYKKDVNISFASSVQLAPANLAMDPVIAENYTAGFPVSGAVRIVNKGPTVSSGQLMKITSNTLFPHEQQISLGTLLPFEQKEFSFSFKKQQFLTNSTHTITMDLAGKPKTETIHVVPVFFQEWGLLGGTLLAIFTIVILVVAIKTRRIHLS